MIEFISYSYPFWPQNRQTLPLLCPIVIIFRVFCSRAGLSLQTQTPRLQSCPKAGLPPQTSGTKVVVLLGMNRCGSFPFLSYPTLSLASEQTLKDLKRSQRHHDEVRRVDLANWALRTSPPKFTTGVEDQSHLGFWPEQRSGNPNHPSPPY